MRVGFSTIARGAARGLGQIPGIVACFALTGPCRARRCRREIAFLERDDFRLNRHPALVYCWSMILSEIRHPLFGIML